MALKQLDLPTVEEDSYWPPPQDEWSYEDYARLSDNGFRYEVYVRRGRAYALLGKFGREEQTRSEVLPDFAIPVKEVFRY
jgi:hypothetical protein